MIFIAAVNCTEVQSQLASGVCCDKISTITFNWFYRLMHCHTTPMELFLQQLSALILKYTFLCHCCYIQHKPPRRFAPCQLDFDSLLSSTTAVPQSPLPSRPYSWLPSTNPLTLPWLLYTSFNPSCHFPLSPSLHLLPFAFPPFLHPSLSFLPPSFLVFPFSSFSFEDVDDYTFLDCSHKYRGLQSNIAYFLSAIF